MPAIKNIKITGIERVFSDNELIVSRTDLKGKIIYCNQLFMKMAGYDENELLGAPHSIIRHPDMPRCVFKLLWDTLKEGKEIFAYVINLCNNGDYYWVFAHVTPTFNEGGQIIGYHSNRRVPEKSALATVKPLYAQLLKIEDSHSNRKEGMQASFDALLAILNEKGVSYEEFILSI